MALDYLFPFTDTQPTQWHLKVAHGRQIWTCDDDSSPSPHQPTIPEKYWLGTLQEDDVAPLIENPKTARDSAVNGFNFFSKLQTEDGHWAGEYGGPMFLLCGLVIACHVTENPLPDPQSLEIIRYLRNTQRDSGGWGLHIEADSTILGTCLNYVVLRLLGLSADDESCTNARCFILKNGGAVGVPSWGKFWLSILNVYSWDGVHPIPPELWLLPSWMPFHPSKIWCHARQIYLPMSYCYAHRVTASLSPLITSLRKELYVNPYESINWRAARDTVSPIDCYAPHHWLLDIANFTLDVFESINIPPLRNHALFVVLDHIRAEDLNSNFIGIGPISKSINMIVTYHAEGKDSSNLRRHVERNLDYLWIGPDGMRMQGTNGSQLWDTALAIVGAHEAGLLSMPKFKPCLLKALEFLDDCQISSKIKQNIPDSQKYYRQPSKGAFPFSTRECGWTVSDCTSEGIKAVILLQNIQGFPQLVSKRRLCDSIDLLLNMQNKDGGYASYESCKGSRFLEKLNPSEVFGEIMIDYSYTECSSAVTQALLLFSKNYPDYRASDIKRAVKGTISFIKSQQGLDGSWFGCWGVCFTYGAWFALEALAKVSETYSNSSSYCSSHVKKGCDYLVSKQSQDGGWGESFQACFEKKWVPNEKSQVVNTAWALIALLAAKYPHRKVLDNAAAFLMSKQKKNGEWKQESIEGVFNKTCMISYPNYKFIFTVWALGKYDSFINTRANE